MSQTWWKESSVYQIYPASFKDSNDDGFGDLEGVIQKLDYIQKLNVDMVWLSPINKSPQVDMGYDISDYKDIDPRYGTLETVDRLIKGLNERGMKFVLDLVVNHTSDQHEWFKQSRSSKSNPKRDWYIWRPAKYDADGNRQPPNNWKSYFTESAWKWDEATQEYYLCLFADEQPDLNWENPGVRAAVHDIVEFWLKRGVSGFRLDVINLISKHPDLPDGPETIPGSKYQWGYKYYANGPRLHEYLQELGAIFKKYDAFTVGEMPHVDDLDEMLRVVGEDREELRTIFQFDLVQLDGAPGPFGLKKWTVQDLTDTIQKWQVPVPKRGGWNSIFIENHDQARTVSRYLSDEPQFRAFASKLMALLVVFQKGTPFVYQGQELAMANIPKSVPIEEYKDVETVNAWKRFLATGPTEDEKDQFLSRVHTKARDHGRTPMHWDKSAHAGFTSGKSDPWMIVTPDYEWNAEDQLKDENSPFHFWSKALALRKQLKDVVVYGDIELLNQGDPNVVTLKRTATDKQLLVILNFAKDNVAYMAPSSFSKVLLNNYDDLEQKDGKLVLKPFQGIVAEV
uniref:ARAD1C14212p n=1 Tax=Blastobotrys adeninivorans TaxID=409370 RepID=A0A060T069_BLAAD